jgi:hypothetical protein
MSRAIRPYSTEAAIRRHKRFHGLQVSFRRNQLSKRSEGSHTTNPTDPIPHDALYPFIHACFEHTVAVFFGDPDQGLNSASGVLLKLERPLLVTALHVIQCYLGRQAQEPSLRLQIARGTIDAVSERIIGQAQGLDLVTLDLTGIDIQSFAENHSYFEPTRWPRSALRVAAM